MNTDVGNDTQQEQCHSCQVEEQPNIQYTSEFVWQLRQSIGNRRGLEYIQQPVTQNMQNYGNRYGLNYKHQPVIQNMQWPITSNQFKICKLMNIARMILLCLHNNLIKIYQVLYI